METFTVKTGAKESLIDITAEVQRAVDKMKTGSGVCYIYTPHTTAAITINENADPSVPKDIIKGLESLNLESVSFSHMEGNSPAHIKSSIVGASEIVFVENGRLQLGTWQGIFFCEFDGPRTRNVLVKVV
ncbi:MAG: secondary thiamine-phosphate synthase enzyme YjbQ [Spirochaetes bacterium]|nr:secondary thiamine-phosphate synthase enzyme YjbQ [Spirochaetota bacterium]